MAAAATGAAAAAQPDPPVLLLDVMDTVVYDPFFQDMPRFFDMPFKELLASKHPTAWLQVQRRACAASAAAAVRAPCHHCCC